MKAEIKDNKLIITLPLNKPYLSKSGKTMIVASTLGPMRTTVEVNDKPVTINVNAYIRKD